MRLSQELADSIYGDGGIAQIIAENPDLKPNVRDYGCSHEELENIIKIGKNYTMVRDIISQNLWKADMDSAFEEVAKSIVGLKRKRTAEPDRKVEFQDDDEESVA